jgi:hypothetical protein
MSEKEINSKWESLKRTERAITDDILKIRDRRQTLEIEYEEFEREARESNHVHTFSGWKKVKSKKEW